MKVKELMKILEKDGWNQTRMRGSHRQYWHPEKAGTVTVAGKTSADIPPGTLAGEHPQAGWSKIATRNMP